MLSICIPVFNVDVRPLITALYEQAKLIDERIEIIIIDDASTKFKTANANLHEIAQYIELAENVGRAKIRNLFLEYARQEYLLFLDCDVLITNPAFLSNYINALKQQVSVLCGGHQYAEKAPQKSERLRWKYGRQKESKSALDRQKDPNRSFMTNNFVVQKNLLSSIRFDERLLHYGHEDTLFGLQLKKKHIAVQHIENPVLIGDSERNETFLLKTELGVQNLVHILQFPEYKEDLWNEIALLRFYKKVKAFRFILLPIFKLSKKLQYNFLKAGNANLKCFDFYKLGILMESMN